VGAKDTESNVTEIYHQVISASEVGHAGGHDHLK
jgi:hypothetical protein